jgi:hypothetical protein
VLAREKGASSEAMSHHVRPGISPLLCSGLVATLGCDVVPASGVRSAVERTDAQALAVADAAQDSTAVELEAPHPSGVSAVTHTVINPPRTGDAKEDYWIQYQVLGELENHTTETLEIVSANLTFHDAAGKMLGVESIGTLSKLDAGDTSPGETIWADVHFVEPGQSVPFHFRRNLAAVDGQIASHRLTPRHARPAVDPPRGVVAELRERFEGEGFGKKRVFEGRIRNDGTGGCRWPALVIAFIGADGKIFALESDDLTEDTKRVLAKGEEIEFSTSLYVTGDDAAREHAKVRTWVDCKPAH